MTGYIDPTSEAFTAFRADDRPGPVHMLNLVRLRSEAAYPDNRTSSGAQAYAAYGRATAPILARIGGRIVWRGSFELTLIGPGDERWDHCFIAEYPSVDAFASMLRDPQYREAIVHRQAAVADSRLIRLAPLSAGTAFAGARPAGAEPKGSVPWSRGVETGPTRAPRLDDRGCPVDRRRRHVRRQ